ncbi:MAG TPA: VCBS repeat-containing protein [Verrucomicrobiae bacterium]
MNRAYTAVLVLVAVWGDSRSATAADAGLTWQQHSGYRVARLQVPTTGRSGFSLLTPEETGIRFTNAPSPERTKTYPPVLEGAGVCAGDVDGDGRPDLYFCNADGPSGLFRNLGGMKFADMTKTARVACTNQISRGAVFADINGDRALDLLVTSVTGPNACLLNDGHGQFHDVTREAGLELLEAGCTSAALGDIDGDGYLDLYIADTGITTAMERIVSMVMRGGRLQLAGRGRQRYKIVDGQLLLKGYPGTLYLNDGRGRFRSQAWTDGTFLDQEGKDLTEPPNELGLSVMFRDLNDDGAPDIYVCNDWGIPDRIWLNNGQGHFRALPDLAIRKTCLYSMSADVADINRDGWDDLYNADMLSRFHTLRLRQLGGTNPPAAVMGETVDRQQARRNTLQLNRGDGTYAEIANYAGAEASDWTWCVAFMDVDLDGFEDLLVLNGHLYDLQDIDRSEQTRASREMRSDVRAGENLSAYPPLRTPNYVFRNRGDCTFQEIGATWGFNSSNACHGVSLVDLDNDGDLDVAVSCLGAPPLIYRNETTVPRVAVRLKGKGPNRFGIGAKIILRGGTVPLQSQEMMCGGRYLSSDEPLRVFAAGSLTNVMTLEVRWRSGYRSLVTHVEPNCLYEIDEAEASTPARPASGAATVCIFEDVSASLGHRHVDRPYDDFSRQALLPRRLSQLGPGVAWFDLDGDGREDLVIGGGRGTGLGVFLNAGGGRWPQLGGMVTNALDDDAAGIAGGVLVPGTRSLLVGLAHYESEQTNLPSVLRFDWGDTNTSRGIASPGMAASTGPLALADLDGDGTLDLFVGGRLVAGRYPEAADSHLYLNKAGRLVPDEAANALLAKAGLVTGGFFSDLDGDGMPDLVMTPEWGPVRVFHNDHGRLQPWDIPLRLMPGEPERNGVPAQATKLSDLTGLWTCAATGDFDEDGRLDLVVGNWGLNSAYQIGSPGPFYIYYGDLAEDGAVHLFEAYREPGTGQVVPARDMAYMERDLPWIRARFGTHKAYSETTLSDILTKGHAVAREVQAAFLGSVVLLNRGERFELHLLPPEAQWTPVMGLAVADLDGDGHEDLFLSQNYFAVRPEDDRLDAGRGLVLRGDGHGGFTALPGQESGIKMYGEQRGCALADYDGDGRVDLVVTQNNDQTRLFHNVSGKLGLRVRLAGPAGNPDGVGTVMRLDYSGRLGPAREVQAGGGFWSQNSAVQVLARSGAPSGIQARWPGGKLVSYALPASAAEVRLTPEGTLTFVR